MRAWLTGQTPLWSSWRDSGLTPPFWHSRIFFRVPFIRGHCHAVHVPG